MDGNRGGEVGGRSGETDLGERRDGKLQLRCKIDKLIKLKKYKRKEHSIHSVRLLFGFLNIKADITRKLLINIMCEYGVGLLKNMEKWG